MPKIHLPSFEDEAEGFANRTVRNRVCPQPHWYEAEAKKVPQPRSNKVKVNRAALRDVKRQNFMHSIADNLFTPSVAMR